MKLDKNSINKLWKLIESYLTDKGYKQPIVKCFKFILHFIVVMCVMVCGALVFAELEDPEVQQISPSISSNNVSSSAKPGGVNSSTAAPKVHDDSEDEFWKDLETKYKIMIQKDMRQGLKLDMCFIKDGHHEVGEYSEGPVEAASDHSIRDHYFLMMKWFYFVTTCTTTIGYGHVHPKTDQGKLFYIFFSITGIALMMTLLKKCGSIITGINRKLIGFVRDNLFRKRRFVSDELMSVFCIIFMFVVFMLTVTWHDSEIAEASHWSNIDRLYFWIVTFTTVGFGDVHFSLTTEVEHAHELLMYRICGLSFLAAIIDSIQIYTKYRNKQLSIKLRRQSVELLSKIRRRSEYRKSDSSISSRNLGPRKLSSITDWQLDALKKMRRKFSNA